MSALNVQRLYEEEHNLALTLQRSLLPRTLPDVAGLEFAVRYVPASDRAEIGGDFYEVVRFDEQLMLAVGDVGGHSLHAATVMAELRHAMRAYLADGHGPAAVLDRLNHLMFELIPGEIATMCLLAVDIPTGGVRLANAGHPPPLMHTPAGVRRLDAHSALLGLRSGPATESEFELAVGDSLVLYTDGLVESRAEVFDLGLDRLSAAVAKLDGDLEQFATRLLEEIRPTTVDDDIAMVVVRRTARPPPARRSGSLKVHGLHVSPSAVASAPVCVAAPLKRSTWPAAPRVHPGRIPPSTSALPQLGMSARRWAGAGEPTKEPPMPAKRRRYQRVARPRRPPRGFGLSLLVIHPVDSPLNKPMIVD